jgi:hypothetical protein
MHRTSAKVAFTLGTANAMVVKRLLEAGITANSRQVEMVDWPNWLTYDELMKVTEHNRLCGCGKLHHHSNN